jgi:haloalkane dehalogenase
MEKMELLRTPDERFENLPDFPFEPNYFEVDKTYAW